MTTIVNVKAPFRNRNHVQVEQIDTPMGGPPQTTVTLLRLGEEMTFYAYPGRELRITEVPRPEPAQASLPSIPLPTSLAVA